MGRGLPFIGSEAIASGTLTRHELRSKYKTLLPNVYLDVQVDASLRDRAVAAWLWSHREGVVSGCAAAHLHGAKWIDADCDVELIWRNGRAPKGVVTRDDLLLPGEMETLCGLPVTTPTRTAFDLGRRGGLASAVARLDALSRATSFEVGQVSELAGRHHNARGLRQLETALGLIDAGAQSPKESWLRVLLIRSGYPKPTTQIPVYGEGWYPRYFLDMGWEDVKLAVEYDGDQHRTSRAQFVKDVERLEWLSQAGWTVIRVLAEHTAEEVLYRVEQAWRDVTVKTTLR